MCRCRILTITGTMNNSTSEIIATMDLFTWKRWQKWSVHQKDFSTLICFISESRINRVAKTQILQSTLFWFWLPILKKSQIAILLFTNKSKTWGLDAPLLSTLSRERNTYFYITKHSSRHTVVKWLKQFIFSQKSKTISSLFWHMKKDLCLCWNLWLPWAWAQ